MIVDFHSHILPGIDDGSKSIEMTEQMLKEAKSQGISLIAATPHFYGDSMSLSKFMGKRQKAYESVLPLAEQLGLRVVVGSEVAFFPGIGQAAEIDQLCYDGTRLMLVEMPFRSWTSRDLKELDRLLDRGIQPIIAHLERFYSLQSDRHIIDELLEYPVYIQMNAECLLRWSTRRIPLQLFRHGQAHLLGSDCHNLTSRRQNLAEGRAVIQKKLGSDCLDAIDRLGAELLLK